ncbi:MAG: GNAT family N-acetyltransferase [Pseudonocardiaceae bacterium]|nr:GNAT family N-acetyltransferase [Pseudonocardiaceae bacterium]
MFIRREKPADAEGIRAVHASAFAAIVEPGSTPVEVGLVDSLRDNDAWLPELAFVALNGEELIGHVICTRGHVAGKPALALGPIGVRAQQQRTGVGSALMYTVLGAADALGEPIVVLLGHTEYYPRFGFRLAAEFGITPPVPEWGPNFMARALTAYRPSIRGEFAYSEPFTNL